MLTTLTLKRAPEAVREACAWFLPGADPDEWLATVAEWPAATEALVFYPVANASGARPLGVLVVPPAGMRLPPGGRALPYGRIADGIYLPVDARVFPPVGDEELRAAMRHSVEVWHPVAGLSGFDAADARRAWDLLLPPEMPDERWNLARAAEPANARLHRVRLAATLSLEDLFGDENKDIGSEPLMELSPAKGEPRPGLPAKLAEGAAAAGALGLRGLKALASLVPRGAGPETWVNQLERWVGKKLQRVNANLERERHRELHRLLEMLERDPANALKHAISLANLANRGRAAPSARLGNHSLDFNLGRLGGRGPADAWDVPADIQHCLATRYRAEAQREAALGNFRRAACIFAELLGDFSAAADMLKRGRFFAEAAVIYRERLRNEQAEAECLAEGGFFDEAIAIHERRGRWLEVAGLQEKAGRPDAARAALRRAVDAHVAAGDRIAAAKLLETRLDAPEEALAQLAAGWPHGRQALGCLEERFALLGRRHDHAAIGALVAELGATETPPVLIAPLIGLLTGLAETLVHEPNRQAAAEAVRTRVADALAARRLDGADELAVLRSLTRLAPQDRLLKRDILRFREGRARPPELPATLPGLPASALVRKIALQKAAPIGLPRVGEWLLVVADEREIDAVARARNGKLFFTRGTWAGAMQSVDWEDPRPEPGVPVVYARLDTSRFLLARPFTKALAGRVMPASDAFGNIMLRGGSELLPEDMVQAAVSRGVLWLVRLVGERVVLASHNRGSLELVHSRDVTEALMAAGEKDGGGTLCVDAQGGDGRVALGYGRHLLVMDGDRAPEVIDLGAAVRALLPAPPSRPGWVALLEQGAVFIDAGSLAVTEVDGQMEVSRGVFLRDSRLVLIGKTEGRLIELRETGVAPLAWFPFDGAKVLAVTHTNKPGEIAVFDAEGAGQRWQLPG